MRDADALMGAFGAGGTLVLVLFLLLLAILWFVLPFAIFGTKRILRDQLNVQLQTLEEIAALRRVLETRLDGGEEATEGASLKAER